MEILTLIGDFFVDKFYCSMKNIEMGNYKLLFLILAILVTFSYLYDTYM